MKKTMLALTVLMVALMAFTMIGCGGGEDTKPVDNGNTTTKNETITIKGSDTMLHINTALAEAYMNKHSDVEVTVAGGGSGTGISAMMNGTTDIAAASRKMKDSEKDAIIGNGSESVEHIIARDGIAVVVHPSNPISELTVAQIGDIYTGKITNWKELGGNDSKIVALSRDNSSGTYAFFQEKVLEKADYRADAKLMASNSAIIAEARQNPNAIGYVGLGYVASAGEKVKALAVSEDGSNYVVPSQETVASGDYSVARPLHLYVLKSAGSKVTNFIEFCFSDEGQRIVEEIGFIPVGSAKSAGGLITIKGSDTMLHINTALAEAYMNRYPNVEVTVAGGGSGTGISAMMNGTTDIAAASRKMKDSEKDAIIGNGSESVEHIIARDGIAVVVHPSNPISELTVAQIGDIYTGKITNWKELGGNDSKIVALSRDNSSGTYAFFQEKVLEKADYRADAKLMASNSAIIAETGQNPNAIGYVGLGYVASAGEKVKALAVSEDGSNYVVPSQETVASGDYSVARPLHLYVLKSAGSNIVDFIDFCFSSAGQKIVEEIGFIPVK